MKLSDYEIMEALKETDKIEVKTPTEEFCLVRKSKYLATLEFIENTLLFVGLMGIIITGLILFA